MLFASRSRTASLRAFRPAVAAGLLALAFLALAAPAVGQSVFEEPHYVTTRSYAQLDPNAFLSMSDQLRAEPDARVVAWGTGEDGVQPTSGWSSRRAGGGWLWYNEVPGENGTVGGAAGVGAHVGTTAEFLYPWLPRPDGTLQPATNNCVKRIRTHMSGQVQVEDQPAWCDVVRSWLISPLTPVTPGGKTLSFTWRKPGSEFSQYPAIGVSVIQGVLDWLSQELGGDQGSWVPRTDNKLLVYVTTDPTGRTGWTEIERIRYYDTFPSDTSDKKFLLQYGLGGYEGQTVRVAFVYEWRPPGSWSPAPDGGWTGHWRQRMRDWQKYYDDAPRLDNINAAIAGWPAGDFPNLLRAYAAGQTYADSVLYENFSHEGYTHGSQPFTAASRGYFGAEAHHRFPGEGWHNGGMWELLRLPNGEAVAATKTSGVFNDRAMRTPFLRPAAPFDTLQFRVGHMGGAGASARVVAEVYDEATGALLREHELYVAAAGQNGNAGVDPASGRLGLGLVQIGLHDAGGRDLRGELIRIAFYSGHETGRLLIDNVGGLPRATPPGHVPDFAGKMLAPDVQTFSRQGDLEFIEGGKAPLAAVLLPHRGYTLEAWVRLGASEITRTLFHSDQVELRVDAGGSLRLAQNGTTAQSAAGSVPANRWAHVAATFRPYIGGDGSKGRVAVLVNGEEVGAADNAGAVRSTGFVRLLDGPSGIFREAAVDELRIWSVAKTPPQIIADQSRAVSSHAPRLRARFSFDESTTEGGSLRDETGGFRLRLGESIWDLDQTFSSAPLREGLVDVVEETAQGPQGRHAVITPRSNLAGVNPVTLFTEGDFEGAYVTNSQETMPGAIGSRIPAVYQVAYTSTGGMAPPLLRIYYGGWNLESPTLLSRHLPANIADWRDVSTFGGDYVTHNASERYFEIDLARGDSYREFTIGTPIVTDIAAWMPPLGYDADLLAHGAAHGIRFYNVNCSMDASEVRNGEVCARAALYQRGEQETSGTIRIRHGAGSENRDFDGVHYDDRVSTSEYAYRSFSRGPGVGVMENFSINLSDGARERYDINGALEGVYSWTYDPAYCDSSGNNCDRQVPSRDTDPTNDQQTGGVYVQRGASKRSAYFDGGQQSGFALGRKVYQYFGSTPWDPANPSADVPSQRLGMNTWSVMGYVRLDPEAPNASWMPIVSTADGGVAVGVQGTKVRGYHRRDYGAPCEVTSSSSLVPGRWHFVAVERMDSGLRIHIDGREDAVKYNCWGGIASDLLDAELLVGRDASARFRGQLDELMLWHTSRNEPALDPGFIFSPEHILRYESEQNGHAELSAYYRFESGFDAWAVDFSYWADPVLRHEGAFAWRSDAPPLAHSLVEALSNDPITAGTSDFSVTYSGSEIYDSTVGLVDAADASLYVRDSLAISDVLPPGFAARSARAALYGFSWDGGTNTVTLTRSGRMALRGEPRLLRRTLGTDWEDLTPHGATCDAATRTCSFSRSGALYDQPNHRWQQTEFFAIGDYITTDLELTARYAGAEEGTRESGELGVVEIVLANAGANPARGVEVSLASDFWTEPSVPLSFDREVALVDTATVGTHPFYQATTRRATYRWRANDLAPGQSDTLRVRYPLVVRGSDQTWTPPVLVAGVGASATGDTDATPANHLGRNEHGFIDLAAIDEDDELYLYLPRRVEGRYRSARTFDGSDQALVFSKDAQAGTDRATFAQPLSATELGLKDASFTAEAWIKPSVTDGTRTIFGQNEAATNQGLHLAVRLGKAWMGFFANDTEGTSTIPANEWTHLAFVYDKDAQEQRIYVNGVLDAVGTSRPPLAGDGAVYLGQSFGGFRFAGALTGVRLWSRARAGGEIRAAMHARLFTGEGLTVALAEDWNLLDDGTTTFFDPTPAAIPSLTGLGHATAHGGGTRATGEALPQVGAYAQAAPGGTALPSGDFAAISSSASSRIHAGARGDSTATLGSEGGALTGGIARRSARTWTAWSASGEAGLTIRYGEIAGVDPAKARLLYRAAPGSPWLDVTRLAAQDDQTETFLLRTSRFGDYAVGEAGQGAGVDNALTLDGDGDYAQTNAPLDLDGDFTIAFWAKAAPDGGVDCYIGQGQAQQNGGLHICWQGDWTMRFGFYADDLDVPAPGTYDWYHWAFTYDRSTGERVIYRNGQELGRGVAAAPYIGSGPLVIGAGGPVGQPAKGQMDDVRVFSRALTPLEVQHYGLNHPEPFAEGLTADWRFDEASGSTAADYAGGHALTLQGDAARTPSTSPRPRGGAQSLVASGAPGASMKPLGATSQDAAIFSVSQAGRDTWLRLSGTPDALVTGEAFPARVTGRSSLVWTVTQKQTGTFTLDGSLTRLTGAFRPGRQRVPLYRPFPGAPWQNASASVASYRDGGAAFVMQNAQPGQYAVGEQLGLSLTPGDALALGGSGYAEGAYSAALSPAQFTFEAWVKPTDAPSRRYIVGSAGGPRHGYVLLLDDANLITVWSGDGTQENWETGPELTTDRWTHVALSHDGTTRRLYVDGLEVSAKAAPYAPQTGRPLRIGSDSWGDPDALFTGQIEEVRLWSEARTQAQIRADMHRLLLGDEANLAAYYRFEGIEGPYRDAFDYAGSNPLALHGDATVLPSEAPLLLSPFYADASQRTARAGGQDARFDVALPEGASAQQRVQVYAFGSPDSTVSRQNEPLPEGVQARSHFVWGVEGFGEAAPDVTIGYDNQGYSPLDARLVYREAYGAPWQDASGDFARDTVNRVFTANQLARFGQYAVADVVAAADLRVRVLGTDTLRVGQPLTRRVVVTNHGPASAVAHVLVQGEGFAADAPERGVFHSESNRWNVGRMFPGQTATLTFAATPTRDSALTLRATATVALGPDDPNAANSARSLVGAPIDAKGNRALRFDGTAEHVVTVGQHAALDLAGPMTVAFWFKTEDAAAYQHLVSKSTGSGDDYETAIHQGKLYSRWNIGGQLVNPYGQTALESNRWYHAAYVYDGSHLLLYLDGVEDGRAEATGAVATGGALLLGQEPTFNNYLQGALDEVAIVGRALTPEQVREQMHRRTPAGLDGLAALYRFDEPSGTRLYDVAGGHHAALAEAGAETRRVRSGAKFGASAQLATAVDQPEEVGTTGTQGSGLAVTPKTTGGGFFALYVAGQADSLVTPGAGEGTEESFPARTQKRTSRIWGITPSGSAEGSSPSADVTFYYGGLEGVSGFQRLRVLRRASPTSPWQDVTDEFTHDPASKTFTALGKSSFSEYALADIAAAPTSLALGLRVLLEGPRDAATGAMSTMLAARGNLPTAHPFTAAPYDVAAASIPDADTDASGVPDFFEQHDTIVDYVLVELRAGDPATATQAAPMTTVARAVGFVHAGGAVTALDGTSALSLSPVLGGGFSEERYYVAVHHRNHLPAMSASAVAFALDGSGGGTGTLGLDSGAAYGGGTKSVGEGKFVLMAGNAALTASGAERVLASDRAAWEAAFALGAQGYHAGDFDLNGRVSASDRALWERAFALGAQSTAPPSALAAPAGAQESPRAQGQSEGAPQGEPKPREEPELREEREPREEPDGRRGPQKGSREENRE